MKTLIVSARLSPWDRRMETPPKEEFQMNKSKAAPEVRKKRCLILYCSSHHQNTETLVKKAAAQLSDIAVMPLSENCLPELSHYELIGLAPAFIWAGPMPQCSLSWRLTKRS